MPRFAPSWRLCCLIAILGMLGCQHTRVPGTTAPERIPEPIAEEELAPVTPPFRVEADPALTRWAMQIPDDAISTRPPRRGAQARDFEIPMRVGRPAIEAAMHQSTIHPNAGDFDRAIVRFDYVEGGLYHLDVGLDAPMLLLFPPGEEVLLVGGLDQKRFLVKEQMERAEGDPTRFMVIAVEANVCGRLTIATVKADYLMEVCSRERPGLAAVAWKHPTAREPTLVVEKFPPPGLYRVGYRWETPRGKSRPVWYPDWIGDTGDQGKTLILFPRERMTTAAPILLVNGPGGTRQVTNSRGRGQWLEIDRQFVSAELRVGHDEHAEVVKIVQEPLHWVTCPRDPGCYPTQTITENPR